MTGSFSHLLTLAIVSLFAYLIPDLVKCRPIYDQLLRRMLQNGKAQKEYSGEKVLLDSVVSHGSAAQNKRVAEISWPAAGLLVSLVRDGDEFVPKGDTVLHAGDRIVLLCDEEAAPAAHQILENQCEKVRVKRE